MILAAFATQAQDLHFSQFNETPALVNPALTGAEAPMKVSLINRDQWKSVTSAFKTYGASLEAKVPLGKSKGRHSPVPGAATHKVFNGLNAGLSFFSDKTGDGSLVSNRINLSASTFLSIGKGHFISAGLQTSYIQRKVNAGNFIFPDQYNGSIYDPGTKTQESFATQSYWYSDAGAGILYSYDKDLKSFDISKWFRAHIGFSTYHLMRPKDQFIFPEIKSDYRHVVHGDLTKSLGKTNIILVPSFMLQFQGPAQEIVVGTLIKHSIKGNSKYTGKNRRSSFGYGGYYRSDDAIVAAVSLELAERFGIFCGYDINISTLKGASRYRGGLEVCLKYTQPRAALYQRR